MKFFFSWILKHKLIAFLLAIILCGGGYYIFKSWRGNTVQTSYNVAIVGKGAVVSTVSGTGQVTVSNQVDLKAKASGEVLAVNVKNGQAVKANTVLAYLNAKNALQTVRDARISLETTQLALQKLTAPADALTLLQAQNALSQAKQAKQNAEEDLVKSYDDAFNSVANAFTNLPTIMSGLRDALYGTTISGGAQEWNMDYYVNTIKDYNGNIVSYRDSAAADYQKARTEYDANFNDYKSASRSSDPAAIESLLSETYKTSKDIAQAVKSTNNLIQFFSDKLIEQNQKPNSTVTTYLSSVNTYITEVNSDLSNLFSVIQTIQTDRNTIVSSEQSIAEKTESLTKLQNGPTSIDLQTEQLAVKQRQNALLDAQETLADYSIRAPFDGIVAKVNIKKGDSLSSGTSAVTFITTQQLATITLNEIDVAKVQLGQKATLTFDAIDNLSISGEVTDVDTIGTVSQGVVSYNIIIGFDTQDARIKPGMSLSASIITASKVDVLTVPNAAIKGRSGSNYVQILNDSALATSGNTQGVFSDILPENRSVTIGLADDANTEIVSGLNEGDLVIVKTITNTSANSSNSAPSLLQSLRPGGNRSNTNSSGRASSGGTTRSSGGESGPPPGM